MIVKGGNFKFTPNRLRVVMMEEFMEVGQIAAKRMESDAKMFLNERIGSGIRGPVSKSSGTLESGIKGYFYSTFDSVFAGVTATALELGQYEASVGEPEEAAQAVSSPVFDYASAVESGTGIYGPKKRMIKTTGKNMRFWTGEYRRSKGEFKRKVYSAREIKGQKPKNFLGDAVITSLPSIVKLLEKVGDNIKIDDVMRWN